jgi:hypothetical protein
VRAGQWQKFQGGACTRLGSGQLWEEGGGRTQALATEEEKCVQVPLSVDL